MLLNILLSCKATVDIADKVDARAPSVRITYPQEECPVIRNSFTLKGIAKDDGKIDKVSVTLKSDFQESNDSEVYVCTLEQKANNYNWKVALNVPNKNGIFPLKDGKYCATIVAVDANGKEGKTTYSFIIDNTPPVLFLYGNHCNNIKDYTGILKLGADLNLRGIAYDASKSMQLEAFFYDNNNYHTRTLNVDGEFDVKIDGFFSNMKSEGFYRSLYGDKVDAGNKAFRYAIKIADTAKEYESPTSNGEGNKGNCSRNFYFYEPLNNALYENEKDECIFPKYDVKDVYNMLASSYDMKEDKKKEATIITQLLAKGVTEEGLPFRFSAPPINKLQETKASETESTNNVSSSENLLLSLPVLILNPLDSPKFEVIDAAPLIIDFDKRSDKVTDKNIDVKTLKKTGDVLNIKLTSFSDSVLLEDSSKFEFYYYSLPKFLKYYEANASIFDPYQKSSNDEALNEISNMIAEFIKIENVAIKKEGSSFLATFSIENVQKEGEPKQTEQKKENKEDGSSSSKSSNENSSDKNPTPKDSSDQDSSSSTEEKEKDENSANKNSTRQESENTETPKKDPSIKETTKEATLKAGETYLIIVKGKDLNGNPFIPSNTKGMKPFGYAGYAFKIEGNTTKEKQPKTETEDEEAPQLLIDEVSQLVKIFPQIKGKIFDAGVGFESKDFTCQASYNAGERFNVPIIWSDEKKGEWKLGKFENTKEGVYQLFFNAKDKKGNKIAERVLKILLDKEEPLLVGINDFSIDGIKAGKKLELKYFQDIHAINIGGEIKESYGLQDIKIGLKQSFDEANDKTFKTLSFKLISSNEGKYSFLTSFDFKKEGEDILLLKIVDVAGRVAVYEVPFVVDKSYNSIKKVQMSSKTSTDFSVKDTTKMVNNEPTSSNTQLPPKLEKDNFSKKPEVLQEMQEEKSVKRVTNAPTNNNSKEKTSDVVSPISINEKQNIYDTTPDNFALFDNLFYSITSLFPLSNSHDDALVTQIKSNTIIATKSERLLSFRAQVKGRKAITSGKLTISSPQGHSKTYYALISHGGEISDLYLLDFNNVDALSIGEGCRVLEFELEDASSLKVRETRVVILDFTPPTIEVMPTKMYDRSVIIRGTLIDENSTSRNIAVSGVDEISLEYKIGNSPFMKEHRVDGIILSKIENSIATWKIDIPNIENYVTSEYKAIRIDDNTWSLPVQIKAKDRAGNETTSKTFEVHFQLTK